MKEKELQVRIVQNDLSTLQILVDTMYAELMARTDSDTAKEIFSDQYVEFCSKKEDLFGDVREFILGKER